MQSSPAIDQILKSLQRDRDEAYNKLKDIDKLIKQIKSGDYSFLNLNGHKIDNNTLESDMRTVADSTIPVSANAAFPLKADTKIQILHIIDTLGKASKLKVIQEKFNEL